MRTVKNASLREIAENCGNADSVIPPPPPNRRGRGTGRSIVGLGGGAGVAKGR